MARTRITVTDNIFPQVLREIREGTAKTLEGAGRWFYMVAREECPVSDIDEPGYVHLVDTIGYDVDTATTMLQWWVTFYVLKHYAIFVNNGTSRMGPRPFFDRGINAMTEHFEDVARASFRDLMLGRVGVRKMD